MKQKGLSHPKLAWLSGIVGMLIGAAIIGFTQWQGYLLGLPFFLIGSAISALITGKAVYVAGWYNGIQCTYRRSSPGTYWLAVFVMLFVAGWLINEFSKVAFT